MTGKRRIVSMSAAMCFSLIILELLALVLSSDVKLLRSTTKIILPLGRSDIAKHPEWCQMRPIRQKIRHPGCEPVYVDNHMCFGQCWSFFIPKRRHSFSSCSKCAPVRTRKQKIEMKCPGMKSGKKIKRVSIVTKCRCRVC